MTMLSKTTLLLVPLCYWTKTTTAFTVPSSPIRARQTIPSSLKVGPYQNINQQSSSSLLKLATSSDNTVDLGKQFDSLLEQGKLAAAEELLRSNPNEPIVTLKEAERWRSVFAAIEEQTAQAEETAEVNTRKMAEFPLTSQARSDMTGMYNTLQKLGQLKVFGAIPSKMPPAAGSHAVRPSLLEEITSLPMQALTPKPTNSLLYAGATLAVLEGIASVALGINLNFMVFFTLLIAATDRLLLNGAVLESFFKLFSPGIQAKIQRHEAGHFLCAYLLGCPVEGCVLDAWSALQDSRFGMGRQVTAGTSFFDPVLSQQINSPQRQVTRSSIDRYSIIVMAGIAAEAEAYGQADGGAGDEMALIAFLSQLNGNAAVPPWNNVTIRNQARWGALQAVLILREYKACYEALVEALENGGSLGDCIYAIEKAASDNNLGPLKEPVGYIVELPGDEEKWTTEPSAESTTSNGASVAAMAATTPSAPVDPKESLDKLSEYKKSVEDKLKAIDERLEGLKKEQ